VLRPPEGGAHCRGTDARQEPPAEASCGYGVVGGFVLEVEKDGSASCQVFLRGADEAVGLG
jgi:hypothetical protein